MLGFGYFRVLGFGKGFRFGVPALGNKPIPPVAATFPKQPQTSMERQRGPF